MAPKATCKFCGKKFQPERLKVHLRYFCGPYAHKTDAQAKQLKKRAPWLVGRGGGGGGTGDDKTVCLRSLHTNTRLGALNLYHAHLPVFQPPDVRALPYVAHADQVRSTSITDCSAANGVVHYQAFEKHQVEYCQLGLSLIHI